MLQTVTPEMVNASLQERARHVLMPHAQQAITQFGLAGGASDATASARMTAMGFTSSPEQALLMLQQRQAASFESTALEAQNSRRTALAQQAAIQDSLPGAITRAYRDSGLSQLAHGFAQSGRNFGRNLAAGSIFGMQMPDLFTPNDVNTDRSVTAGGLESARRLTSAQLGMYEDYTRGSMAAFGGGGYSPGSMYSGGFLQGSSGLMTAEQLRTRGFTADFFEAGEDQLNARHAVLSNNPVLDRQMARADAAGMKSLGIGKNQLEGRDFVRTESPVLGENYVIRADTLNAAGDAYSRGVASITGGGQRGTDAREMLKASLYVNRAEGGGGSARTSYVRAGRNMGILSRRGFDNVSSQERAALVLREQVLRRSGVVEDSVSESMYAGMGRDEQVRFMTGLQGQLDEASGYDSGLRDLIGSTGNARGIAGSADIELSTEAVASVSRAARASIQREYGDAIEPADLKGFGKSFQNSPEFREAFADMIELANTVESRAEGAKGYTADNREKYMQASFEQGQLEINAIAARFRDTAGGEALRAIAQNYGAVKSGSRTSNALTRTGTSQDAELVRASGAIEQYHRASDPAIRRLTERITDFNYRHQKERVSGSDKGYEGGTQAFRDSMREASGFARGLYEDEAAESASYDRHLSFMSENFDDSAAFGMMTFHHAGEFGGVTVGDKTVAFTSQQQLNDFVGAKRGSVRLMRDTRDRFDHSTYGQEAEGSVGQEFY
ncbi:MAG: hypothetical protein VXZ72_03850, partial [Chlamydiota bacterium]|nr:hypothetical protein [Chlamydiota bacterium]